MDGGKKGKVGRKLSSTEPATKRIAQVRQAARAYRERKEKYLRDLEAAVAALKANQDVDVVSLSATYCKNLIPEFQSPQVTESMRQQVAALELENSELRAVVFGGPSLNGFAAFAPPVSAAEIEPTSQDTMLGITAGSDNTVSWESDLDALFKGAENAIPPTTYSSFKDLHESASMNELLFGLGDDTTLLNLISSPLPDPPSPTQIISPYFEGVKNKLMIIKSLALDTQEVQNLIGLYVHFVMVGTDETYPHECKKTFAKIQTSQSTILQSCSGNMEDTAEVVKIFDAVQRRFNINIHEDDFCPKMKPT